MQLIIFIYIFESIIIGYVYGFKEIIIIFNLTGTIFIVSEFVQGSTLTEFINIYGVNSRPNIMWPIILQLLLGSNFIHDKGYAHRDVKPDNILITKDYTIKYIDFGLACLRRCGPNACRDNCRGQSGTILYSPPEYFNQRPLNSLKASKAHDIWSFAVVIFQLCNGILSFPFQTNNNINIIERNIAIAPQYTSNYTNDGRTNVYIMSLLINDWRLRPTIKLAMKSFIMDVLSKIW